MGYLQKTRLLWVDYKDEARVRMFWEGEKVATLNGSDCIAEL